MRTRCKDKLSLRRHRTRTKKYDRLLHQFRHRSTRLCVTTQVYHIQWNNAMWPPFRRSRSFKVTYFGTNRKTSYYWLILTYLLSYTVSKLRLIIGQIFAGEKNSLFSLGVMSPVNIAISDISLITRFFGLYLRCRKYWCIFNHGFLGNPPRKLPNSVKLRGRYSYYAVQGHQGHRVWYHSKTHMRLPSD